LLFQNVTAWCLTLKKFFEEEQPGVIGAPDCRFEHRPVDNSRNTLDHRTERLIELRSVGLVAPTGAGYQYYHTVVTEAVDFRRKRSNVKKNKKKLLCYLKSALKSSNACKCS
jgi:hypothetical protein